ncbi:M15 family metallopeptidase [Clostridium cadaveris]|uniref:D-alanyl-D-alanine carboxypeptidase n=2 Tax=Clostridium cadaveris TaxID=1529 RepID=A0A1I2PWY5_9CLOT|nr:M15 family metallopeptidase [Clostridium cadaveris]MDM8311933.1 M15 family metallopeptidase [Clostridium cadaveris]SFG17901.1 D-alanyl-D-alanine carboxypeptidase [Clostridium cadaveris]
MKKLFRGIILFIYMITLFIVCPAMAEEAKNDEAYSITTKQDILTMMMAYPEYINDIEKSSDGKVFIITKSGKKILYDDGKKKNFDGKMNNADIQDILEEPYPLNMIDHLMEVNKDPGRFRCYALLNEVYGASQSQVSKHLVGVSAPYNKYLFNKNNGAAEALGKAMEELRGIASGNGKVAGLINPINGSFNYRVISGTGQLSPHAYGIALDINSSPSDYWKWATREAGEKRMKYYPKELVETFEKYNFVWGGKWGHFDILHFEYRPEIIIKAKYFQNGSFTKDKWFGDVPMNEEVESYIKKINEALD